MPQTECPYGTVCLSYLDVMSSSISITFSLVNLIFALQRISSPQPNYPSQLSHQTPLCTNHTPLTTKMPISKKDRRTKEHKKAEAAGTRAPVKANGLPVKAPKPKSLCQNCRKELVSEFVAQLEAHAATHSADWPKEKCFPNDFKA